jgi:hypothetical protein
MVFPALKAPLVALMNEFLQRGRYPAAWKRAVIVPIPKTASPSACEHYRPISIANAVGKIFDSVVRSQVSDHVFRHRLLSDRQSAFRPRYSALKAVVGVLDDLREAMDHHLVSILVTLDLARAYDSVRHDLLVAQLPRLGFGPTEVRWVESFLTNREVALRGPDGAQTGWRPLISGVPQGSCLSPVLFNIYVDDLTRLPLQSEVLLYADDVLLRLSVAGAALEDGVSAVNADLATIEEWLRSRGMRLNPAKCTATVVGTKRMLARYPVPAVRRVVVAGVPLPYSPTFRYLGVYIHQHLSWEEQFSRAIRRVHWGLRQLRGMVYFPPARLRLRLVQALLFPILDYCLLPGTDCSAGELARLQVAQNACLRYAVRPGPREHMTPWYARLGLLKMKERRTFFVISTGLDVLRCREPAYLSARLCTMGEAHGRDTRRRGTSVLIPGHRSARMSGSFAASFARLFNALPEGMTENLSRRKLRQHLARGYDLDVP